MPVKSVAVIGGGASGLVATKECLQQGFDATCYEMHDDIGGIWYFTKEPRQDEGATVYDFLITNTCREMMRFSDFNFPDDAPIFPEHHEIHRYLKAYADHFGVTQKVQLYTKVVNLKKSAEYEQTGRWVVETQRRDQNNTESKEFDFVINCTGFHRTPNIPEIDGLSTFRGKWSHSITFKNTKPFAGKRVLVIGNANSAIDAATGMCRVTDQVYLSVGNGCWVMPRTANCITTDMYLSRRVFLYNTAILDRVWRRVCQNYFNHDELGIRPSDSPLHHFAVVNDDIGSRISSGKIKVVSRTVQFFFNGVKLEDGTEINNIDHVFFATGFKRGSTLLDAETVVNSFKHVIPVNETKPTLAFVGMVSTSGSHPPTAELQARMATAMFAGKYKPPDKNIMKEDIKRRRQITQDIFGPGKHWVSGPILQDEIAKEIGVYPSFWKVFTKSPRVAFQTKYGPAIPAQFRILGDGATETAVGDCLNVWQLLTKGVKLRKVETFIKEPLWPVYQQILTFLAVGFAVLGVIWAAYCRK